MKEALKALLIITCILLAIGGLFFFFIIDKLTDSYQPTYTKTELKSSQDNSKIFIKSKNWGVTGDHQITVISLNEEEFEPDSTQEYVYHGLEPFLYKVKEYTLLVFPWEKALVPAKFNSNWVITQKEVENPEMADLRANPDVKRIKN